MTGKVTTKPADAPPPPPPEVQAVEAPVISIPDGANEAGCQPPSVVGTCFDACRCTETPQEEGE